MSAIGIQIKQQGFYKLVRRKAVVDDYGNVVPGEVIEETGWNGNLFTKNYFNVTAFAGDSSTGANHYGVARNCLVGTDNTAASESQTTLMSFVKASINNQPVRNTNFVNYSTSPRYIEQTAIYRFNQPGADYNLSEVGITGVSFPTGSAAVNSRAVLSPTVSWKSDEFLDVYFKVRTYVPEDVTGTVSITIDGTPTDFNYTLRPCNMGVTAGWGGYTVMPYLAIWPMPNDGGITLSSGSSLVDYDKNVPYDSPLDVSDVAVTRQSWVTDSKSATFRVAWSVNRGNRSFTLLKIGVHSGSGGGIATFQILLDKPISKTSTKKLYFDIKYTLANGAP